MDCRTLTVPPEAAGTRLDVFLKDSLSVTRAQCQKWLSDGRVTVNGVPAGKQARLAAGDTVDVAVPQPVSYDVRPEEIPLDIVYEDDDLLVVNKPKGMVVHPAAGHYTGTLVNALLYHCQDSLSGINGVLRPGIVHRIDKDTSGLLMVAKNDFAHQHLAAQIAEHSFTRVYETVVCGHLRETEGTVDQPIGRHPVDRQRMAVTPRGSRRAVTHYRVLESLPGYDYVQVTLETGRTHQIRVHMAFLGHPVAGDTVYGSQKGLPGLQGQCLHARQIGFTHPRTGERLTFTSDLPPYFTEFLHRVRGEDT